MHAYMQIILKVAGGKKSRISLENEVKKSLYARMHALVYTQTISDYGDSACGWP